MTTGRKLAAISLAPLWLLTAAASPGDAPLQLEMPIRCRIGDDCLIQQYPDHGARPDPASRAGATTAADAVADTGAGARDYRCGPMSYAGHDGTDFRLTTAQVQRAGVAVLAAAAGIVRGARDGMVDRDVRIAGAASVAGRECGNGVVLAHPGGWETQYCHLAQGSLQVGPGQKVAAGTVLGRVGESGDAAFPHLHLAVRRDGAAIDPFSGKAIGAVCGPGLSYWSQAAAAALSYQSPGLLDAGFTRRPITLDEAQDGPDAALRPTADAPALIAYGRMIGLAAGDRARISLIAPDGRVLAVNEAPALIRDRAEQFLFAGARRKEPRWPGGRYQARIEVLRGGVRKLDRTATLRID